MDALFNAAGRMSLALAVMAKLVLVAIVLLVVTDVVLRNLNLRPLAWGVSAAEYGLLYAAFLPMPWLVRTKGHVFVEFFRKPLPIRARNALERVVYLTCIALSLYLGWYAVSSMIDAIRTGAYETRTFDMPRWAVFLPMTAAFFLSAVEWARFLACHDSLYDYDPLDKEGL